MKFNAREVLLKNNRSVIIRTARTSDAENLLNTARLYIADSEYIPKLAEEIKLTIEQEEEWINSYSENEDSLLLVAEYQGQIIGNIDLTSNRRKIMAHTAVIGMGILKEWRNTGLGTAMLTSIIEWAKQNKTLELIWLEVYTENTLGVSLYKKMGFKENGVVKGFFKQDGRYYDKLTMTLNVKGDK